MAKQLPKVQIGQWELNMCPKGSNLHFFSCEEATSPHLQQIKALSPTKSLRRHLISKQIPPSSQAASPTPTKTQFRSQLFVGELCPPLWMRLLMQPQKLV